jgi:DNA-binding NarL/FixJ family response regulator
VIVDDHVMFVQGLSLLLEACDAGSFEVVGTTARAADAEELVRRARPDLAIVDLAMAPPGGLEVIRVLSLRYPQVRILALSGTDSEKLALQALMAGASGFMPKSADMAVLLAPIRAVLEGWATLPRELLMHLMIRASRPDEVLLDRLNEDEKRVWRLLADGAETAEVARRCCVSDRTAKRLVASVLRKIGATNRTQAAVRAIRAGLLDDTM